MTPCPSHVCIRCRFGEAVIATSTSCRDDRPRRRTHRDTQQRQPGGAHARHGCAALRAASLRQSRAARLAGAVRSWQDLGVDVAVPAAEISVQPLPRLRTDSLRPCSRHRPAPAQLLHIHVQQIAGTGILAPGTRSGGRCAAVRSAGALEPVHLGQPRQPSPGVMNRDTHRGGPQAQTEARRTGPGVLGHPGRHDRDGGLQRGLSGHSPRPAPPLAEADELRRCSTTGTDSRCESLSR